MKTDKELFDDNQPLFELHAPDGHVWRVYEDGNYTGFPDGTFILNNSINLLDSLRGRIKQLQAAS